MAKDDSPGYPVGNQDPSKRGFGKRPEREQGGNPPAGGGRGGKPGHGDVTGKPSKK